MDNLGVPILYAPSEFINAAAEDPSSPAAKTFNRLTQDLSNWHAGMQAHMILPSDLQNGSSTSREFDVKLVGIDGGGKQYKTTELIDQRRNAILNCFGAGFMRLGQNGTGGSYALSDNQKGIHSFFVQRVIRFIEEVINNQLIPQLLALNEIYLDEEDMPVFKAGMVDQEDRDIASKVVQRAVATGFLPMTPEIINEGMEKLGYSYRIPEEYLKSPEKWKEFLSQYMPKATTRSGDGLAAGGLNGTSSNVSSEDLDATNLES